MAGFETGDRVMATEGISGMVFTKVPKGTEGVVKSVSWLGGSITVDFSNGVTEIVRESQIAKINKSSSWW